MLDTLTAAQLQSGSDSTQSSRGPHDFDFSDAKHPLGAVTVETSKVPSDELPYGTFHSSNGSVSPDREYAVGTAPEEFYERTLPPWRAAARKFVIRRLQDESKWIERLQERVRSPWLDTYFVYTSSLGTHTFFMTVLPALFFFGYADIGRGLVFVLSMGVYVASFIKDLICAPRPYSPPVARLTIGSHHLEYGFPSTHSTNSVSIALYMYSLLHTQYFTANSISTLTYSLFCIFLIIYAFSIVFGRLYAGMHSLVDCAAGIALGTGVWAVHALWWTNIEDWLVGAPGSSFSLSPSWLSPLIVASLCGLIVHWHPQPADDCPCFEDAIAFVSVVTGQLIVQWASIALGYDDERLVSRMPGNPFSFLSSSSSSASALWWAVALLKLTSGISLIFIWRLAAKFMLHHLLPPLFRFISYGVLPRLVSINMLPQGVELPNRRFYTPATEYDGVVPEKEGGLFPIPSVIDLSGLGVGERGKRGEREFYERGFYEVGGELGGMKRRKGKGKGRRKSADLGGGGGGRGARAVQREPETGGRQSEKGWGRELRTEESGSDDGEDVKHYDADVLTKVVVYAGIGVIATGAIPIMFEVLGLGLHP